MGLAAGASGGPARVSWACSIFLLDLLGSGLASKNGHNSGPEGVLTRIPGAREHATWRWWGTEAAVIESILGEVLRPASRELSAVWTGRASPSQGHSFQGDR